MLALLPAGASAQRLCIATNGCDGDATRTFDPTQAGLQAALSKASTDAGLDVIEIGPVTIDITASQVSTTPSIGNDVGIEGVGGEASTIHVNVANGGGMFFNFSAVPGASGISNLNIVMDGVQVSSRTALTQFGGRLTGVDFDITGNSGFGSYGLTVGSNTECLNCTFKLHGDGAVGVNANGSGKLTNTTIENPGASDSTRGISLSGTGPVNVENSRFTGLRHAAIFDSGAINIRDSLIDLGSRANAHGMYISNDNNSLSTLNGSFDGVTVVGTGANQHGMYVASQSSAGTETANGTVKNTLIKLSGAGSKDIECLEGTNGVSTVAVDYSAKAAASPVLGGTGACDSTGANNIDAGPLTSSALFVDAATADYRLKPAAPVIDLGDPLTSGSRSDVSGGARFVDGATLLPGGIIDMGGFEYQNYSPSKPTLSVAPLSALVGEPIQFGASSTDANGDTVSYSWSFGDGENATGANTTHAFAQPGDYLVNVSASDSNLQSEFAEQLVTISAAPLPDPPILPAPPTDPIPTLVVAAKAKKAFKNTGKGFVVSTKPSTPSVKIEANVEQPVTLTIARIKGGYVVGGKCKAKQGKTGSTKRCNLPVKGTAEVIVPAGISYLTWGGKFKGKRYSGKYLVTGVSHKMKVDGLMGPRMSTNLSIQKQK